MDFVGPIISTINGLLGILFSKTGEKKNFNKLTYVFLTIALLSGGLSIWGVYNSHSEARDKAEQLSREKRAADSMRGFLLAKSFVGRDTPIDAKLIITMPDIAEEVNPEDYLLYPLIGGLISRSILKFSITDIVDFDYTIKSGEKDIVALIDVSFYDFDEKKCALSLRKYSQKFTMIKQSDCQTKSKFEYNAWIDSVPSSALIIDLPKNERFLKLFSRLEQQSRAAPTTAGSITIETQNEGVARRVFEIMSDYQVQIKFFQLYSKNKEENCYSSLLITYNTKKERKLTNVNISIENIADYELNLCEIVPI
jgi:hypothetical protein